MIFVYLLDMVYGYKLKCHNSPDEMHFKSFICWYELSSFDTSKLMNDDRSV